jgi:hypothetical protein
VNPVQELRRVDSGNWLLRVAAEHGVALRRADLPAGVLGQYVRRTHTISLDPQLDSYGDWEKAAVLAHELQHAHDDMAGQLLRGADGCYKNEEHAFARGAEIWSRLWQGRLPAPQNSLASELNGIAVAIARDPAGFAAEVVQLYHQECTAE